MYIGIVRGGGQRGCSLPYRVGDIFWKNTKAEHGEILGTVIDFSVSCVTNYPRSRDSGEMQSKELCFESYVELGHYSHIPGLCVEDILM